MNICDERGYLVAVTHSHTHDYLGCASKLAETIKIFHPTAKTALVTDINIQQAENFDYVTHFPYGDKKTSGGAFYNDWQVFYASPFRQTIKLEADMLIVSPIDHLWSLFQHRDVVISQGATNFYNQITNARHYRQLFDYNHLPDVYNAVTYWRLCPLAKQFFTYVQQIFENWLEVKQVLKYCDEPASTDVVYAIAAMLCGVDTVTLPINISPKITHMKRHICGTSGEKWTEELVWERNSQGLKVQTIYQKDFFHYYVKDWLNE